MADTGERDGWATPIAETSATVRALRSRVAVCEEMDRRGALADLTAAEARLASLYRERQAARSLAARGHVRERRALRESIEQR